MLAAVKWLQKEIPRRYMLIALGIAALLALVANSWFFLSRHEPSTRSLIREASAFPTTQSSPAAQAALRSRGTGALPDLIAAARKRDSSLDGLYARAYPTLPATIQRLLPLPVPPWSQRSMAASYLGGLGPAAAPAVPALIDLTHCTNNFENIHALDALRRIGPVAEEAKPRLRELVTDPSELVRLKIGRAHV